MAQWQDGGESGMVDQTQAGSAHWNRAMALQKQERDAERTHGFNSPEAKALHQEAAAERSAALAAGYTLSGGSNERSGRDRRGGR